MLQHLEVVALAAYLRALEAEPADLWFWCWKQVLQVLEVLAVLHSVRSIVNPVVGVSSAWGLSSAAFDR